MNLPATRTLERVVIATRRSRLALWQAEHVKQRLAELYPRLDVQLLPLSTRGDELLEARLDTAGGKGLFVKELEAAIDDGRADLAVHSMKDVPVALPEGFVLAAITAREDARDAFVANRYAALAELPDGATVGTSSLRRAAQIAERRPGLRLRTLRGNLDTRLAKLDRGEYDAVILAAAGLRRLGLVGRIRSLLEVADSLPAAGQGALGIECRARDRALRELIAPLADAATDACVRAERAVNLALGGNCAVPLGAYAELEGARLRLRALVASPDGRRIARADRTGDASRPELLGEQAAQVLREQGALEILAQLVAPE